MRTVTMVLHVLENEVHMLYARIELASNSLLKVVDLGFLIVLSVRAIEFTLYKLGFKKASMSHWTPDTQLRDTTLFRRRHYPILGSMILNLNSLSRLLLRKKL
jgi:hypothetical protein